VPRSSLALSRERMSLVAPVTAILIAVVPLLFGIEDARDRPRSHSAERSSPARRRDRDGRTGARRARRAGSCRQGGRSAVVPRELAPRQPVGPRSFRGGGGAGIGYGTFSIYLDRTSSDAGSGLLAAGEDRRGSGSWSWAWSRSPAPPWFPRSDHATPASRRRRSRWRRLLPARCLQAGLLFLVSVILAPYPRGDRRARSHGASRSTACDPDHRAGVLDGSVAMMAIG
jgi:hypothetical protein